MKFWKAYDLTASILSEKTKALCQEPITHGYLLKADRSELFSGGLLVNPSKLSLGKV